MNQPICDTCGKNAHPALFVNSKSRPDIMYHLCMQHAVKLRKDLTINDVFVSQNTITEFRNKVKKIVNDAYNAGTLYRTPFTTCRDCKVPQSQSVFEGSFAILEALGLDKQKNFVCSQCVQKYL